MELHWSLLPAKPRDGLAWVRFALAADLCAWGVILALPGDTFASSHSYDLMAAWFSEETWAVILGLLGIISLAGLQATNRWLRFVAVDVGLLFQAIMCVTFGLGRQVSTGLGTHLVVLVLACWAAWREATDA